MFLIYDNTAPNDSPILLAEKLVGQEIVHRVKGANPAVDDVIIFLQTKRSSPEP
jgi:hypothetical protein